jgi:zinc transport system permease protein
MFDNIFLILISLSLGLSLPLIGVFVILRKEALLSDALAHTLLLGIALSITFKINALAGILAFAVLAGIGIFLIKEKANLGTDAIVGVFFTTSLAIGSLLISSEELLEAFLGNLGNITKGDVIVSVIMAILIVGILLFKFREFAFSSFSPDLAKVDKLDVKKYELLFILILALGVAMGIKLVGTLLISALIIVPAATAKIFSIQIRSMALWSMLFGIISVFGGLVASSAFKSSTGPTIILFGSSIFFLVFAFNSLLRQK